MQSIRGLFTSLLLITVVSAQDAAGAAAQDPIAAIRTMYKDLITKRADSEKQVAEVMEQMKRAQGSDRMELTKKVERLRMDSKVPTGEFLAAFRKVDWSKLDPKADADLMREGLMPTVTYLEDPEMAELASRLMMKNFPDDAVIPFIRGRTLPKALIALGKGEEAVSVLREAIPVVKESEKANTLLMLGDLIAVRGDFEGAKAVYADVEKLGDKAGGQLAAARIPLIGQPAPEIDSSQWIGGEAAKLSSLKGKVVLVGFWASWSPTARSATKTWSELHDQFSGQGLQCLGMTKLLGHGYLPADDAQLVRGGAGKQGMTPDEYVAHVQQFHTNIRIHYPFVIAKDDDFKNYRVLPLPTVVLINREGKVALVSTAHDGEQLVKYGVQQLLAKAQ